MSYKNLNSEVLEKCMHILIEVTYGQNNKFETKYNVGCVVFSNMVTVAWSQSHEMADSQRKWQQKDVYTFLNHFYIAELTKSVETGLVWRFPVIISSDNVHRAPNNGMIREWGIGNTVEGRGRDLPLYTRTIPAVAKEITNKLYKYNWSPC
jgi:hypothetical protein